MRENKPVYGIVEGNGSDEELQKYKECFEQNESEKNLDVLKWFHQENLRGEQSILYALDPENNNIAAIYTYLPVIIKCIGENVPALQSFDTLTDHRHRGQGLFIQLASKLAEKETHKGNALVFGFPNENSVHGFVKKLGFAYFGEVPFLIKPLRLCYFVKKLTGRNIPDNENDSDCTMTADPEVLLRHSAQIKRIDHFDAHYELLWQKVKQSIPIAVNRDAAYMNWRFVKKPHTEYFRYGYFEGTELKAIVVFVLKKKHGGKIGYLMELLFDPESKEAGKELLRFSSRIFKKNRADVILTWCYPHSFNYGAFRNAGFYRFPEKLRPQKLGVIVKVLKSMAEKEILKMENWYLSYSDSDTV